MHHMEDPRNFWDKLFRRRKKVVQTKDDEYGFSRQSVYTFDWRGGIIGKADFDIVANGMLIKREDRTFTRQRDGSYDPETTSYFNGIGVLIKRKDYSRNSDGMLCCSEDKYIARDKESLLVESSFSTYTGGLWVTQKKDIRERDSFGRVIHESSFQLPEGGSELVCVWDRTSVRQPDGSYDPKEATRFDDQGRVTQKTIYHREMTEIDDKPMLFADETSYSYPDGEQQVDRHTITYSLYGRYWASMKELEEQTKRVREEKARKIQELEAQLAELRGEKKPEPTDTQRLAALRRGKDPH